MSFSQYTPFFRVQPESKKQLSLPLESISKLGCNACTLNKITLIHPKMDATGDTDPLFYFFAEAPGSTEDELGEQLIGESGQMIRTRIPSKWKKRIRVSKKRKRYSMSRKAKIIFRNNFRQH